MFGRSVAAVVRSAGVVREQRRTGDDDERSEAVIAVSEQRSAPSLRWQCLVAAVLATIMVAVPFMAVAPR